MILLRSLDIID